MFPSNLDLPDGLTEERIKRERLERLGDYFDDVRRCAGRRRSFGDRQHADVVTFLVAGQLEKIRLKNMERGAEEIDVYKINDDNDDDDDGNSNQIKISTVCETKRFKIQRIQIIFL